MRACFQRADIEASSWKTRCLWTHRFAIITATVFQWPGMGLLFIQAVSFADIPGMVAYPCLIALIFVLFNLAVDLSYFLVDPRLRGGRTGGH